MTSDQRTGPTIVLILILFFILVQAGALVFALTKEGIGLFWKVLAVLVPLLVIVALISVYIERMQEISDQEKDDLDKY